MTRTISIRLFSTLQKGKERLSEEALGRIVRFVESQRTEDGAFMNKNGKSDLYYTVFGWMLCHVLGIKTNVKKNAAYLEDIDAGSLDLIHYAAYMRCRMIQRLFMSGKAGLFLKSLIPLKTRMSKGFTGVPHNDANSPYTQFVWLSLMEDSGVRVKDKKSIADSLKCYRASNGGYTNTTGGLAATTNATVAALAVKGQLEGYADNEDIRFLYGLQESSGGFGAAEASPVSDLLSTATALFMLRCYGLQPKYPAREFIEAHWLDSGGFSATLLDDKSDVEYTFYGLLALGAITG